MKLYMILSGAVLIMRNQDNLLSQFTAEERLQLLDYECFYQLYIYLKDKVGWKDEQIRGCIADVLQERKASAEMEAKEAKRREEEMLTEIKRQASLGILDEEVKKGKEQFSSPFKKQISVGTLKAVDMENLYVMTSTFPYIEECLKFRNKELVGIIPEMFPNPSTQDMDRLEQLYAVENKRYQEMKIDQFEYPLMTTVLNRTLRFLREFLPQLASQLKDLLTRKYLGEVLREMYIGSIFGERALEGRCIRSASVITKSVAE